MTIAPQVPKVKGFQASIVPPELEPVQRVALVLLAELAHEIRRPQIEDLRAERGLDRILDVAPEIPVQIHAAGMPGGEIVDEPRDATASDIWPALTPQS